LPVADGKGEAVVNVYTIDDGVLMDDATGGHSINPSEGSLKRVAYQKDFTDQDGLGDWEYWSLQLQKVHDFSSNEASPQRVIAFDFEMGYVPTWETDANGNVTSRPPQYEGATLGGLDRMRGFEGDRFSDKAGVYYGVEYRIIPRWQPLTKVQFLDWANIRYWQFAVFAEAGEVADSWGIEDLHSNMKIDGGISIRGMFYQAVCRLDIAISEEGSRVVAMYGHPF
jgi:outer membrane protein assembly factor BamA